MATIPKELKIHSFKDFCIRCEDIYFYFEEYYAPFFDIGIYRDYIYDKAPLSEKPAKQESYANVIWEYLMGDITIDDLVEFSSRERKK